MYAITVRPTDKTDAKGRHRPGPENMAVSYTHLTLLTIYSV